MDGLHGDLLLKNVLLPGGRVADVLLHDGTVAHVGAGGRCDETLDCTGHLVLPGALDMHVHMRGGEQRYKEDWGSGTRSAIAGGVTLVVDQPNLIPPLTSAALLESRVREAGREALCQYAVNAGVMPGAELESMWGAGALAFGETFAAPSSYGDAVGDAVLADALRRIARLGALITVHAEEVHPGDDDSLAVHNERRPGAGEARQVAAVAAMCPPGTRIHFCHLSCIHSIDVARGSVEVTPHHLFLSLERFEPEDGFGKVNPPLRSEKARKKVWSRWDRIDVIASDHAPHTRDEKSGSFAEVPSGIPGVETMVPLLVAEVLKSKITLESLIEKTAYNPAMILGVRRSGFATGDRADFALYPRELGRVDADVLHSRAGWSPFEGMDAVFPRTVVMRGTVVFDAGEYFPGNPAWFPGQGFISAENK
jgi:dihydroorotase